MFFKKVVIKKKCVTNQPTFTNVNNTAWKRVGREAVDGCVQIVLEGNDLTEECADLTILFDVTLELPPRQVFAFLVVR